MNRFLKVILIILFCGLWETAYSAGEICLPPGTALYFGNGIRTLKFDAKLSLDAIQARLDSSSLSQAQKDSLDPNLAYNNTNGAILDILESSLQTLQNDTSRFWRILGNLQPLPDWLKDKFLQMETSIQQGALVTNADLQQHLANYNLKFLEGKKVVVVSHSQGNFFVNQAYGLIPPAEQQSFGIVSVANPDSEVRDGRGLYTTLTTDLVIAAVMEAKIQANDPFLPLLPNITNGLISPDFPLGHNFRLAYLEHGSNSEAKIVSNIVASINTLPAPTQAVQQGIITATLTWGAQPDVDLHVFEPNGAHVYYGNLRGPSGFLDHDVVTGYGPEHYFVSCDTLEAGTYRIGVNYYNGSAPELARVEIKAGSALGNYAIPLSTAVGSAGNDTPIPVANINVTGDKTIGFTFSLQ